MPVKNLSPSPVLYGANVNPHQSPQEFYTCESKFKQEKKKGGSDFYYVNFIGTFPSCPYIQKSVWIQLQLHLLPHICSLIVIVTFSQGISETTPPKESPSPLGPRWQRSKSLQHSCTMTWIMLCSSLKIAFLIRKLPLDRWVSKSGAQQGQCPRSPCRCAALLCNPQHVCGWIFTRRGVRLGIAKSP